MFYQQGKLFSNWGKYLPIRKIIVWWPRAFLRSKSKVAQRPQIRPPRLFWPKIETFWFYWFWRNGKSRFLARHFWWFSKTVRKGSYKRLVFFLWKENVYTVFFCVVIVTLFRPLGRIWQMENSFLGLGNWHNFQLKVALPLKASKQTSITLSFFFLEFQLS